MSRKYRFLALLVLLALLLSACQPIQPPSNPEPTTDQMTTPAITPTITLTAPALPYFLPTGCLYRVSPADNVECGFLLVPESHADPSSRTIRLHVLRFKSSSEHPAPDPLIVLNGGPGSPGAPVVASLLYDDLGIAWRAERDVIYIDQRGSNYSLPSLQCESESLEPDVFAALDYAEHAKRQVSQVQACQQQLLAQGVNLAAYTLLESAADINDLRLALGYEQVNLYGFSYGSLLAMSVMRDEPEGVRSVILDAVLPPGVDLRCEKPLCIQHALDALFAACAADTRCDAAYPALASVFYSVVEGLTREPVDVTLQFLGEDTHVMVDDLKFINHVIHFLQIDGFSRLPADIYAAHQGDFRAVARTWLSYAYSQEQSMRRGENSATGLYYATMCSYLNSYPASSTSSSLAAETTLHPAIAAFARDAFGGCDVWQPAAVEERRAAQPVVSSIPTLMLVGAFDPALPHSLSQAAADLLPNNFYFELPCGHGAIFSPCGLQLTLEFLADPTAPPDGRCVAEMKVEWKMP